MADQELRRGGRILVSGGVLSLDEETIDKISDCCDAARRYKNPAYLSRRDAAYLQEFVSISDSFITGKISMLAARKEIAELNEKMPGVADSIKKTDVSSPRGIDVYGPGSDYWDEGEEIDEGWMPSRICVG